MLGFASAVCYLRRFSKRLCQLAIFIGALCWQALAQAFSSYWNMPRGVTPVSHGIYHLHMVAFWVGVVISSFIFLWMIWIFVRYRHSKGAIPGNVHEHMGVEIVWTVIPIILLVILAIPATKILIKIHDDEKPAMSVKVTGYQWKWNYEYLDQGIRFFSNLATSQAEINNERPPGPNYLLEVDHPLVLPVGEKIRFLITSNDVIHDWWVPDLGVKQDAIPGYVNETWTKIEKVGTYRGECAELCGTYHGFMPIVVKAVSPAAFKQWVAKQKTVSNGLTPTKPKAPAKPMTESELLTLGKTVYGKNCAVCHQTNGKGLPPTFPGLVASPIATGALEGHINIVLHGKKGTAMQAFSEQLSPSEIAAVITYERQAWGNAELNKKAGHPVLVHAADIVKKEIEESGS